jgi:hypothetical protein
LSPADEQAIEAAAQWRLDANRQQEERRARQSKYDAFLAETIVNHSPRAGRPRRRRVKAS